MIAASVLVGIVVQLTTGSIIHEVTLNETHGGDSQASWTASEIAFVVTWKIAIPILVLCLGGVLCLIVAARRRSH